VLPLQAQPNQQAEAIAPMKYYILLLQCGIRLKIAKLWSRIIRCVLQLEIALTFKGNKHHTQVIQHGQCEEILCTDGRTPTRFLFNPEYKPFYSIRLPPQTRCRNNKLLMSCTHQNPKNVGKRWLCLTIIRMGLSWHSRHIT
jgi:hypothetical protein